MEWWKATQQKLDSTRDAKYRKQTEAQLYGYMRLSEITKTQQQNKTMMEKKRERIIAKKARAIVTPFGDYQSVAEYRIANPDAKTFQDQMKIKPHLYYYKDEGPGEVTYEEVLYSPYGCMPKLDTTRGGIARLKTLCEKNNNELALKYKDIQAWWRKAKKENPTQFYSKKEPKREWLLEKGIDNND